MPSLLHYEIVTDPTSLQASLPGEPSTGTVYIIVSNTHKSIVEWEYIDVEVPWGPDASDLTDSPAAVVTSIERTVTTPRDEALEFKWDNNVQRYRAQFDWSQSPIRAYPELLYHGALILKLENIPVTEGAGLVLLKIHDRARGGDTGPHAFGIGHCTTTLGLTKQTPRIPRNFRAEKSRIDGDAGQAVVFLWDGPTDLDYSILDQTGAPVHNEAAAPGPSAHQQFRRQPGFAPKRGTTYTLVAKPPGVTNHQGYFLTATVHATIPEFESGTRTRWIEGTVDKGRVVFTADGVDVQDQNHSDLGTLRAKRADVDAVITRLVQGRTDDAGWINFPDTGVNVYHGPTSTPGVITAERADVQGVNTTWAGRRAAGQGWIDFSDDGATVYKDDTPNRGTLAADKADISDGVNTTWVGDRDGGNGWIDFPQDGVEIHRDGSPDLGALRAEAAEINDGVNTPWVGDRVHEKGWIEFPQDGIDVRKDEDGWGTVAAGLASLNDLRTGSARVKGLLTVLGGMNLSHEGKIGRERGTLFSTRPDAVVFTGANEFKQGVRFEKGILVINDKYSVSMTKESGDMLVSGAGLQVQGGTISISSGGNPPQVRTL
ncbi:hypothetical protein [Streptomyces sp. NPDC059063]|uniref:hypothetical protein n=1 Tax=unclassified Streptomyces TaxID=2593676 RepID=UPI00369D6892